MCSYSLLSVHPWTHPHIIGPELSNYSIYANTIIIKKEKKKHTAFHPYFPLATVLSLPYLGDMIFGHHFFPGFVN